MIGHQVGVGAVAADPDNRRLAGDQALQQRLQHRVDGPRVTTVYWCMARYSKETPTNPEGIEGPAGVVETVAESVSADAAQARMAMVTSAAAIVRQARRRSTRGMVAMVRGGAADRFTEPSLVRRAVKL